MEEKTNKNLSKTKIIIIVAVCAVALIAVIAILLMVLSGKPSRYEDKMRDVAKAFYNESKMKNVIEDGIIDLRAAAAWAETIDDSMEGIDVEEQIEDFKKELKETKKDDKSVEELENALLDYAKLREDGETKMRVKDIKKPKQSKKDRRIWTVDATHEYEFEWDGEVMESKVRYVFYNGKIIDVGDIEEIDGKKVMESDFKMTIEYYNL